MNINVGWEFLCSRQDYFCSLKANVNCFYFFKKVLLFPVTTKSRRNTHFIYAATYILYLYTYIYAASIYPMSVPTLNYIRVNENQEAIRFLSPLNVMSIKFHGAPHLLSIWENYKQYAQQQSQTNEAEVNIYPRIFAVSLYLYLKTHLHTFKTVDKDCLICFINSKKKVQKISISYKFMIFCC